MNGQILIACHFVTGSPQLLDPQEASEAISEARANLDDERARTRAGFADPLTTPAQPAPASRPTRGRKATDKAAEAAKIAEAAKAAKAAKAAEAAKAAKAAEAAKMAEAARALKAARAADAARAAEEARAAEAARTRDAVKAAEVAAAAKAARRAEQAFAARMAEAELQAAQAKQRAKEAEEAMEAMQAELRRQPPTSNPYRDQARAGPSGQTPSRPLAAQQAAQFFDVDSDDEDTPLVQPRTPLPPPAGMAGPSKVADRIRGLLPQFQDWPDEYLAAQPIDVIQRCMREEKLAQESKPNVKLDMRLHANFSKAKAHPALVPEGYDNRADQLHEGRYLPGAGVKAADHWLRAREVWGDNGVEAIANYDTQTLGMSGCITARGWEALHKPGSQELSLKLFTVANVGQASTGSKAISISGEDGFIIQESWKEINDMNEVRTAFRNMRRAAHLVRPWDLSFETIDGFLTATTFMDDDLKAFKKAPLVAGFIDHILALNAANWVQEAPFLDMPQIQVLWTAWWGTRKATAVKTDGPKTSHEKGGQDGHQKGQAGGRGRGHSGGRGKGWKPDGWRGAHGWQGGHQGGFQARGGMGGNGGGRIPPLPYPITENNICRAYNKGKCGFAWWNCVRNTMTGPLRLHHKCNLMVKDASGKSELCMKLHARPDHK